MPDMTPAELLALAATDPDAAAAIATVSMAESTATLASATASLVDATSALVDVTIALVVVGLLIGVGQICAIVYGIWKMGEGNKARAEQHREAMDTEANRHKEAMEKLAAERTESDRRHKEAMESHKESMKTLNALIRNTGRRNRPIPAR